MKFPSRLISYNRTPEQIISEYEERERKRALEAEDAGAEKPRHDVGEPEPEAPAIVPADPADLKSWILLPESSQYSYPDTLVLKAVQHQGRNWTQAHEALAASGNYMLRLRQYVDFLAGLQANKLYDGAGKHLSKAESLHIFNQITEVRDPWRAEWLDADFKLVNKVLRMNYGHRIKAGRLVPLHSEPLDACLMEAGTPGISLEDWLSRATRQGMPPEDVQDGGLHYWQPPPDGNSVAWFRADACGAVLCCSWGPRVSDAALGVRPARARQTAP